MKNLCFRILTRPCFIRICVTLASNPGLFKFLHTPCQRFCQHSEPCLYPCFSIFQQTMVKEWRGAGGQVWKGRILSLTKNSHRYGPAQTLILLDPLHCYKKFIHAVGDHHWPRKIHGWSAHVKKKYLFSWGFRKSTGGFCRTVASSLANSYQFLM